MLQTYSSMFIQCLVVMIVLVSNVLVNEAYRSNVLHEKRAFFAYEYVPNTCYICTCLLSVRVFLGEKFIVDVTYILLKSY